MALEYLLRGKFIMIDCKSSAGMKKALRETITLIEKAEALGAKADTSSAGDDYIYLRGTNPKLKELGFQEEMNDG